MFDVLPYISTLPPQLASALLAALPVTELRAALPLALTVFELDPVTAYISTVLGNMVPIFLIFALLPSVVRFAENHSPWLKNILDRYFRSLSKKHEKKFQRYGTLALVLFVMIPLPGSGVWTGSLLAILFDIKPKHAIPAIVAGLLAAGVLVLLITQGTIGALSFLL